MATVKSESIFTRMLPPRLKKRAVPPGTTYLLLRVSPEVSRVIDHLVDRTGMPEADVLNMAVGFFKAATDAMADGKRVSFLNEDGTIAKEFSRF